MAANASLMELSFYILVWVPACTVQQHIHDRSTRRYARNIVGRLAFEMRMKEVKDWEVGGHRKDW